MPEQEETATYNVVFLSTEKAGPYEGVMTWTGYPSKEDFEKCRDKALDNGRYKVLAAGITSVQASRLCMQTPLVVRMRVARFEATNPKTGEVNMAIYEMKLATAFYAVYCS